MKIALITDTHWGVRNDSEVFHNHTKKFLDNTFFPYIDKNGIDTVIHLGDLVDRRKFINISTLRRLKQDFLAPMFQRGLNVHIIAGNHDTYFKNTNEVNAIDEIGISLKHFYLHTRGPAEVEFDGTKILFIPWICDDNRKETEECIKKTDAQICFGHLELAGFQMYRGSVNEHGDDPNIFNRFDIVCSGHFHTKSSSRNIHYLGSHAQFTWSDYGDERGFHVFDTETREIEFIENPTKVFEKIFYNDDVDLEQDFSVYKDKFIKVIIQNKDKPYTFDRFIDLLNKSNPADVQVVEDHLNLNLTEDNEIVDEAEDTLTIFRKYITNVDSPVDKSALVRVLTEVHQEALSLK